MKLNDLTVVKGSHIILSRISATFDSPCTGIIGANGEGKTTLLNTIIAKDHFEGEILNHLSYSYAGQISDMETELTVSEILEYSVINSGTGIWKYCDTLEAFDLSHLKDHSFNSLSGGEKQRVNLACSLYQKSELVIWDEPTNYLDPRHIKALVDIVIKEKTHRKFLIVSHHMNFILSTTDKILGLKNKEICFFEEASVAFNQKLFDDIFDIELTYMCDDERRSVTI